MFVLELQTALSLYFQPASSHNKRIYPIHCLKHETSWQAARSSLMLTSILKPVSETGWWPFLFPLKHSLSKPQCSVAAFFFGCRSLQRLQLQTLASLCFAEGLRTPLNRFYWVLWMWRMPCSEDTGPSPGGYKLNSVSGLLVTPGEVTLHASDCSCGVDVMGWTLFRVTVDGWKGKLPSCALMFLQCMKHCRWVKEGDRATFLTLLPPLLTGLRGRVGMRSKRISTAAKHGCAT